jgi:hypothetical protein
VRLRSICAAVVYALLLVAISLAFLRYEGTTGFFLLFNVSYLLLVLMAVPRPRSYVYTFLSLFVFLGFWLKFTLHTIIGYDYQDAVGAFDGSAAAWDLVLLVASSAAIGIVLIRGLHLWLARHFEEQMAERSDNAINIPVWYVRFKKPLWVGTILLVIALNAWNTVASFYQIGVNPKVILPIHLNVLATWLINIGFALWISVLVQWETNLHPRALKYALLAPIAEGLISTVSVLSRSVYLFHTLPYAFVVTGRYVRRTSALTNRAAGLLTVLFALLFVVGLVAVSGLRLYTYPGALNLSTPRPETTSPSVADPSGTVDTSVSETAEPILTRNQVIWIATKQVLGLFVDRWNGLEGVLAVSSYEGLGYDLLVEGLKEDPNKGENSIYQEISNSDVVYQEQEGFTFLNLVGIVGFLFYSGSLLMVGIGMASVTLLMMAIEIVFFRLVHNPFLSSVSGLAMANVVCQINFPYLTGIFFVQLLFAMTFIWLLQKASKTTAAPIPVLNQVSHERA